MADDDETTKTDAPPPSDPAPEPAHPENSNDEVKGLIHALSERVSELENTLRTVISVKQDTTPTKKPWTHRNFR